jgi:hypothetical protein
MTREQLAAALCRAYYYPEEIGSWETQHPLTRERYLRQADLILPLVEAADISERTIANGKLNICGVCHCLFHHCEGLHPDCKGAKLRAALRGVMGDEKQC